MSKSRIAVLCGILLMGSAVHAATVLVAVMQNEQAPATALQMSSAMEDQILGAYFDWGHIVTNDEITSEGSSFTEKGYGLGPARAVWADFMLVILLEYSPVEVVDSSLGITYARLSGISWRMVQVRDGIILVEKKLPPTSVPVSEPDPYRRARILADTIAKESRDALLGARR